MTPQPPAISVVIPTLNRAAPLVNVLRYFIEDEPFRDFEVVIIDQSDEHNQAVIELSGNSPISIRYEYVDFRQTTRARNLGVRLARGEIIVFSEDDVEPWPGLLAEYARFFENPSVQGATGPVLNPGQRLRKRWELTTREMKLVEAKCAMPLDVDFAFEAWYGAGGNSGYRKAAIETAGGFDENYVGNAWGEEFEFAFRFRKNVGPIHYHPAAGVVHLAIASGGSRNASPADYIRDFVRNSLYTAARTETPFYLYPLVVWHCFRRLVLNKNTLRRGGVISGIRSLLKGVVQALRLLRNAR